VPWLEWAYCDCGDPTGAGRAESLVYNPLRPPHGANVNHTTLKWLDEPYPLRIAGQPLGYSFDQSTATFRLRYATRSPVTNHPSRARTVIYPSPLHYPHGYRVTVKGGHVESHHARRLVIRATHRAHKVTVTLRPRKR
jgi:endoglycosylceramidase